MENKHESEHTVEADFAAGTWRCLECDAKGDLDESPPDEGSGFMAAICLAIFVSFIVFLLLTWFP